LKFNFETISRPETVSGTVYQNRDVLYDNPIIFLRHYTHNHTRHAFVSREKYNIIIPIQIYNNYVLFLLHNVLVEYSDYTHEIRMIMWFLFQIYMIMYVK